MDQMLMIRKSVIDRLPLFLVFLSGVGFSLQALTVKTLSEEGFAASFELVFTRGCIQGLISAVIIYNDADRLNGNGTKLFGETNYIRTIMFLRSLVGYFGIAFVFMSVEYIPMGDAGTLAMLSPLIASIAAYFILGEPWRIPELCATVVSLTGAVLVAKPPFLFGSDDSSDNGSRQFFLGVTYALISALSAGFAFIFVRMLGTTVKMPWSNVCFAQAVGQVVLALPSSYLMGQRLSLALTTAQILMILGGGLVGAISQIMMTIGMQREKSAAATAMRMSDVVFGFIWQSLFTHDAVSYLSVIGAMLVSSSILIIVVFKPKADTTKAVATTAGIDSSSGDVQLKQRTPSKVLNNHGAVAGTVDYSGCGSDDYDFEEDEEIGFCDDTDSDSDSNDNTSAAARAMRGMRGSLLLPLSHTGDVLSRLVLSQLHVQSHDYISSSSSNVTNSTSTYSLAAAPSLATATRTLESAKSSNSSSSYRTIPQS